MTIPKKQPLKQPKKADSDKIGNVKTAYESLKNAWNTWASDFEKIKPDNRTPDALSAPLEALNVAKTNYLEVCTANSFTSTIPAPDIVLTAEDLAKSDWYNTVTGYKNLWYEFQDPTEANKQEATAIAAKETEINDTNYLESLIIPQNDRSTVTDNITKRDDAAALQGQDVNATQEKKELDAANSTVTTTKAQRDSAYTLWQSILNGTSSNVFLKDGDEYSFEFTVWVQNERQEDDDANFVAGEKGVVIRPVKNETNTITWENSDRTLARLTFQADSDTDYLCPRLSTRWSNEDYYNFFDDQDAYLFDFVSNPDIPAQTRGTLELYNPFLDRDGDYYRDVRDLYLYQVVDGILKEVDFDPVLENDDGEEVLRLRTRTLGTYVVCEDPLDLDDLYGDEDKDDNKKPSRPSDANKPDIIIDANQKPVPNTGR